MIDTVWPLGHIRRALGAALRERAKAREISQTCERKRVAESRYALPALHEKCVVFDVYYPQNLMHLVPLYAALQRRGGVPVYVAIRDAREETRSAAISRGVSAAHILMGDALVKTRPVLVVACDQSSDWLHAPVPEVPRVQIFHGCILKSHAKAIPDLAKFDHFFFPGPLYRKTFEAQVAPLLNRTVRYHDTGMPRTDDILALRTMRAEAIAALGLDSGKKTVLYSPTWHLEASFVSYGIAIAKAVSELGLQLLVRPHPLAFAPMLGRARQRALAVLDSCAAFPGVVLAHDKDDRYVMAASDMMIADYGSIAYEYLILDRPVVFFDCPEYRHLLQEDDLESWGRAAGTVVANVEELRTAIMASVGEPEAKAAQRKAVLDKIFFNLGQASDVCCQEIEALRDRVVSAE